MYLALEGLTLMECFGFYQWPAIERDELLKEIRALLHPEPQSQPERG
jgi:hypothetical protein